MNAEKKLEKILSIAETNMTLEWSDADASAEWGYIVDLIKGYHQDDEQPDTNKPTPIPENGWTDEDINRTVFLKMPHGTLVEDRIVFINTHDGGQYIGPATELGALAARMSFVIPILLEHDAYIMSMDNDTEKQGDEQ